MSLEWSLCLFVVTEISETISSFFSGSETETKPETETGSSSETEKESEADPEEPEGDQPPLADRDTNEDSVGAGTSEVRGFTAQFSV